MVPKRVSPYFDKMEVNSTLVKGGIVCCDSQDFDVYIFGELRKYFFGLHVYLNGGEIALMVKCDKCENEMLIFNNECDGYDRVCGEFWNNGDVNILEFAQFKCKCCLGNSFSIEVKYEYAALDEIEDDKIDNAFTWIWVALECNLCHAKYKNFISYETC